MPHFKPIDEQLTDLLRGAVDVASLDELKARLRQCVNTGKPLRVKLGVDPSSPDLHLGHTLQMRRLRAFQDHGHQAVLIIGDYTAMVGDPSGKNKTRPQLTHQAVEQNAQTYLDQAGKVLDLSRLEIRRNGEWFSKMHFMDVLKLCARTTVARLLERDDFLKRYKAEQPISLHEFLYPLMQGWDSVMVQADVELGGSDQLFNLLMGRKLQEQEGMHPQVCITGPLLEGLDGEQKMSKSLNNAIAINENARDMFGKTMSIPDSAMRKWFTYLTRTTLERIETLCDPARTHPREAKLALAHLITRDLHGDEAAHAARAAFEAISRKKLPEDIKSAAVALEGESVAVWALVKQVHGGSGAEARRLVSQGGVHLIEPDNLDERTLNDEKAQFGKSELDGRILKVGKRHFYRLKLS
ncbi:MAG: Tyrosine--tRNA ligase [Planctomycetes bacterium]|nr:Tyrosine--tRNA ligase [Planctomycetota bacterium]HRJ78752.1 tyrosine--tRNA ligase [Planctomycetota bacterium]